MSLTPKTTHVDEGLARLVEQFRDKPRIRALLTAYLEQVQEVEDALGQLLGDRWADSATGAQLDGLGELVGEPRRGRDDATYRLHLRVRVLVNVTSGTPEHLLAIARMLVGDGVALALEEHPPAALLMQSGVTSADPAVVAEVLADAKVGGVSTIYRFQTAAPSASFGFAGGDAVGFGAGQLAGAREV